MNKILLFCWLLFAFALNSKAQKHLNIDKMLILHQKPIIIFFSADYCHYCSWMKKTTFSKKNNQLLYEQFLFVEIKEDFPGKISFKGEHFIAQSNKIHPFVLKHAKINERVSYPTTLLIHQNQEIIFKEKGFISKKDFTQLTKKWLAGIISPNVVTNVTLKPF